MDIMLLMLCYVMLLLDVINDLLGEEIIGTFYEN